MIFNPQEPSYIYDHQLIGGWWLQLQERNQSDMIHTLIIIVSHYHKSQTARGIIVYP